MVHCSSEAPNSVDPITFGGFQRLEYTGYTHQLCKQQLSSQTCRSQLLWSGRLGSAPSSSCDTCKVTKGKREKRGVHIPAPGADCLQPGHITQA